MKNERLVYNGFHKIIELESEIKNKTVKREKLIIKNAVAGIVIDEEERMGLVSQYRPIIQRTTKEIPAGVLDKEGRTASEILIEELWEECEIPLEDILYISEKPVHDYYMMAGIADGTIAFYEVRVKKQQNKLVQDADVDSVEWVDQETMQKYIRDGVISDGKTILAYYYWLTNSLMKSPSY